MYSISEHFRPCSIQKNIDIIYDMKKIRLSSNWRKNLGHLLFTRILTLSHVSRNCGYLHLTKIKVSLIWEQTNLGCHQFAIELQLYTENQLPRMTPTVLIARWRWRLLDPTSLLQFVKFWHFPAFMVLLKWNSQKLPSVLVCVLQFLQKVPKDPKGLSH